MLPPVFCMLSDRFLGHLRRCDDHSAEANPWDTAVHVFDFAAGGSYEEAFDLSEADKGGFLAHDRLLDILLQKLQALA